MVQEELEEDGEDIEASIIKADICLALCFVTVAWHIQWTFVSISVVLLAMLAPVSSTAIQKFGTGRRSRVARNVSR